MKKQLKHIVPAIFPMPVILIATYNEDGTVDVMNAAWGCAYDMNQIQLNISESHRTTKNIRRTGVFTVTVATADHIPEADYVKPITLALFPLIVLKINLNAADSKHISLILLMHQF